MKAAEKFLKEIILNFLCEIFFRFQEISSFHELEVKDYISKINERRKSLHFYIFFFYVQSLNNRLKNNFRQINMEANLNDDS